MFLSTIAKTGRIVVPPLESDPPNLRQLLEEDVLEREAAHRLELVHPSPAFDAAAATWASLLLFRCCQFVVFRDIGDAIVEQVFLVAPPAAPEPSICYSVDVAFCFLPDLFRLAQGISPEDPVVTAMIQLARTWPGLSERSGGCDRTAQFVVPL